MVATAPPPNPSSSTSGTPASPRTRPAYPPKQPLDKTPALRKLYRNLTDASLSFLKLFSAASPASPNSPSGTLAAIGHLLNQARAEAATNDRRRAQLADTHAAALAANNKLRQENLEYFVYTADLEDRLEARTAKLNQLQREQAAAAQAHQVALDDAARAAEQQTKAAVQAALQAQATRFKRSQAEWRERIEVEVRQEVEAEVRSKVAAAVATATGLKRKAEDQLTEPRAMKFPPSRYPPGFNGQEITASPPFKSVDGDWDWSWDCDWRCSELYDGTLPNSSSDDAEA